MKATIVEPRPSPHSSEPLRPDDCDNHMPAESGPGTDSATIQEALPAIAEAARQVGGFDHLADIAEQLGENDAGR